MDKLMGDLKKWVDKRIQLMINATILLALIGVMLMILSVADRIGAMKPSHSPEEPRVFHGTILSRSVPIVGTYNTYHTIEVKVDDAEDPKVIAKVVVHYSEIARQPDIFGVGCKIRFVVCEANGVRNWFHGYLAPGVGRP